jgi:hypothetical protein
MTQQKSELMSGVTIPRQFIVVANQKGGQGKSLISLAIADHAFLHDAQLAIAQLDTQLRLAQALGRKVLTVHPVAREARRDPSADARAFTPFYSLMEKAAARRANSLFDIGANQVDRFTAWAGLVDLDEDLAAWQVETIVCIPFVAEGEGIRQASLTAKLLMESFPTAQLVLIENERDGLIKGLHPASDAAAAYRSAFGTLKDRAKIVRMPAVKAGSWRPFEGARCRLIDVPQMAVEKVMSLTALPRPEAKIARGDVAAWAAIVFAELDRVLPWSGKGGAS